MPPYGAAIRIPRRGWRPRQPVPTSPVGAIAESPAEARPCPTSGPPRASAPTMQTHVPRRGDPCGRPPTRARVRQRATKGRPYGVRLSVPRPCPTSGRGRAPPLRCKPASPRRGGACPSRRPASASHNGPGRAPPLRCKPASPRRGGCQPPTASPAPAKKPASAARSEKQPPPGLFFRYRRAISVSARARARTKSAPVKVCRPVLVVQGMFSFMMSSSRIFYLQAHHSANAVP